ncbi:MAG: cytochrome c [Candidatus Limnocylindrales bacterium]
MTPATARSTRGRAARAAVLAAGLALLLAACGNNMVDQPKLAAQQGSAFFADGSGARPPVEGTVSRAVGAIDPAFFTGQQGGALATELPIELSVELLQRGQQRYDIYCAVCHGYTGAGDGMIVTRGFPAPTSFHAERLLAQPVGYFFNAATNGFGRMYPYASRIPAEDRWAISAYVKALQISQNGTQDDVPAAVLLEILGTEGRAR